VDCPKLGPTQQDNRSVVSIVIEDVDPWLFGTVEQAPELLRVPPVDAFGAWPVG